MTNSTTRPMRRRQQLMPRPHLRSAESLAAAQDALAKVQDKKDALYARLDDLADALGCDRDEAIGLIDKASKIDTDNDDIHPVNTTDNGAGAIAQGREICRLPAAIRPRRW